MQTLIGATVYHFASGEVGEGMLGGPLLSAEAVRARKAEVKAFLHHGLAARAPHQSGRRTIVDKLMQEHRKRFGDFEVIEFVDEPRDRAAARADRRRGAAAR